MSKVNVQKYVTYSYYITCIAKTYISYVFLHVFKRNLLKREIWLVREKRTEARDNGYHLFKYITKEHPEIEIYYVITKDSPDYDKVAKIGHTVSASSFKHHILWLSSKYSISSQQNGAVPDPTDVLYRMRFLCRKDQKVIFITHGIQKDEMSHDFDYEKTKFSLVTCTARREYEFIKKTYGYSSQTAKVLGLCRFDNLPLDAKPKKQILIMPTFRSWLAAVNREKEATDSEKQRFMQSSFYDAYKQILCDSGLLNQIRKNGYRIVFYLHYSLQSFTSCFEPLQNDCVVVAKRQNYDVQELLIESSILITDYSSIFFDFAYMGKPEAFYQFDEDEYRSKHYQKGYFDYRDDGFGPVIHDSKDLIHWLNSTIESDARIEGKYLERITSFFDIRDNRNCERVYNAIIDLK